MDGWRQILENYPVLQTAWDMLCVTVPFSVLFAYAGIYYLSGTAKILAVTRKRAAFDKCAKQIALLGLIFGWALLVGSRVYLYMTQESRQPENIEKFLLEMSWLLLSIGVLLSTIYFFLWKTLKKMPVLHTTLAMISAAQNCLALISILFTVHLLATIGNVPIDTINWMSSMPENWDAPVWQAVCFTPPLIFAMAGAFSACWLVLRRKHDDFGRDYYNNMIPWCVAWARNAWIILFIFLATMGGMQIWRNYTVGFFNERDAMMESSRLIFWIIPILFWTLVHKSRIALRHKFILFLTLVIAMGFMLPYFLDITLTEIITGQIPAR